MAIDHEISAPEPQMAMPVSQPVEPNTAWSSQQRASAPGIETPAQVNHSNCSRVLPVEARNRARAANAPPTRWAMIPSTETVRRLSHEPRYGVGTASA